MEGIRKVGAGCLGVQPPRCTEQKPPFTYSGGPVAITAYDPARQHHRCCAAQGVRECACISHSLYFCQLRPGDIYLCRRSPCQPVELGHFRPIIQYVRASTVLWPRLTLRHTDIVDIKPVNMEELTEVITAAEFHPTQCNVFMYSSSKSNIKLADMREAALCDRQAKSECCSLLSRIFRYLCRSLPSSVRRGRRSNKPFFLL